VRPEILVCKRSGYRFLCIDRIGSAGVEYSASGKNHVRQAARATLIFEFLMHLVC
jgi:hypothetical protein